METYYCVGCRAAQPMDTMGHMTAGAHRDGDMVGFCAGCAHTLLYTDGVLSAAAPSDVADLDHLDGLDDLDDEEREIVAAIRRRRASG